MPSHVLIGTDGSAFALKAARYGLELARSATARATAIMVTPTWDSIALSEVATGGAFETFAARSKAHADACLAQVRAIASELAVPCDAVHAVADRPYAAIIETARARGCDLLVIGSHGRRGVARLVLGSQAARLVAESNIPVLVYRE